MSLISMSSKPVSVMSNPPSRRFRHTVLQQCLIPGAIQCQLVVCNPQRGFLRIGQAGEQQRGQFRHVEALGGFKASVACDQDVIFVQKQRVGEAKLGD